MKTLLLGLAICFFSLTSFADNSPELFQGTWKGKGSYILNGKITLCSIFKLNFAATKNSFEFSSGHRECETHQEEFYKVQMDFRDGGLYYKDLKVGEMVDNTLTAAYSMPEENGHIRHWRMFMRRQGNHLMYEESRTMDNDTTPLISFAGVLILEQ